MTKDQKRAAQFLLTVYEISGKDAWQGYATDKLTVKVVCALVNLGIAKVNEFDQFALKSEIKAKQFLNA